VDRDTPKVVAASSNASPLTSLICVIDRHIAIRRGELEPGETLAIRDTVPAPAVGLGEEGGAAVL